MRKFYSISIPQLHPHWRGSCLAVCGVEEGTWALFAS